VTASYCRLPRAGLRERDPLARAAFFAAPRLAEVFAGAFGEDFFAAFLAPPVEAFLATFVARAATFGFFAAAADFAFRGAQLDRSPLAGARFAAGARSLCCRRRRRAHGRRCLRFRFDEIFFLRPAEIDDHRLEIIRLPAAFFVALVLVGHVAVLERQERAVFGLLQQNGDDRVLELVVEFRGADALARNEFEIAAGDVAVPGGHIGHR
jgi:hypothetical protein